MVSRCTNPNRRPNDRRETERSILLPPLIEDIRPTRLERRRAERGRRRGRHQRVQRPLLPPRTAPSVPTGSLTPTSSEGLNNRAELNHGLLVLENYTPATQAHVPVEPDDSTQESYGAEHEAFTATLQAATSESYHRDPNSASASRTIDFDIPIVDEEYVFLEPDATVSQVDAGIPSTVRDLVLNSSREYEDHFQPRNMNQIQLRDHLDEVSREAQQRIPLPDLNPDANDPSVRMTFENGDVSHDKVYFDDELEHSFMSYDYLWRIRAASGRLPYVIEAPPIDRETLTPGGMLAPIKYLLYADLDWESSGLPFPRSQLYFIIYRGNGTMYDTKPVLGRNWSEMVERQAPSGA